MARKKRKNINAKKAAARQGSVKPVKAEIKETQDVKETALTMEEGQKGADMLGEVKEAAAEKAEEVMEETVKKVMDVKEDSVEKTEEVMEAAKEKAEEMKAAVEEKAEEMKAAVKETAEETGEIMADKAQNVKEAAEEKTEEIKAAVGEKAEKAEKAAEGVKESVEEMAAVEEPVKEPAADIYVQYHGLENDMASVIRRIKESYYLKGSNTAPIETLQIYIKPEDYTAYYVINEIVDGKVSLF